MSNTRRNSSTMSSRSILRAAQSKPESKSSPQLVFSEINGRSLSKLETKKSRLNSIMGKISEANPGILVSGVNCECAPNLYTTVLGPTVDEAFLEAYHSIRTFCDKFTTCQIQEAPPKMSSVKFPPTEEPAPPPTVTPEMVSEILQTIGLSPEMASAIIQTSIESIREKKPSMLSNFMQTSTPELLSKILQTIGLEPEMAEAVVQTSFPMFSKPSSITILDPQDSEKEQSIESEIIEPDPPEISEIIPPSEVKVEIPVESVKSVPPPPEPRKRNCRCCKCSVHINVENLQPNKANEPSKISQASSVKEASKMSMQSFKEEIELSKISVQSLKSEKEPSDKSHLSMEEVTQQKACCRCKPSHSQEPVAVITEPEIIRKRCLCPAERVKKPRCACNSRSHSRSRSRSKTPSRSKFTSGIGDSCPPRANHVAIVNDPTRFYYLYEFYSQTTNQ